MKNTKAAFFDIDGTIWNRYNEIPESTVTAIQKLRQKGVLTFLCSGRSRGYIQNPRLLNLGFDGIVSGCGTMVEYRGETIFYHPVAPKLMEYTVETVRRYGFRPILEGPEYLYMDDEEFGEDDPYGRKLRAELGEHRRTIREHWGRWDTCKLSCATENADQEGCFSELAPHYDFIIHSSTVVEILPKGYHKGTGVKKVCELLNLDLANTYAFGDSANDLGMLETAGTSIVMGDGQDVALAAADYITLPLMEGGIYHACEHFGLI